MTDPDAIRAAIADACRALAADGLVKGTAGNVSARVDGGVAITATGVVFAEATAEDVSVVDGDGRVVAGSLAPSSELGLHLAAYADDAVGAVVHTHAPGAIAVSLVLARPLVRRPWLALAIGIAVIVAGNAVALPAFELARADFEYGTISESQRAKAREAVHELFDTIAGDPARPRRRGRRRPPSALDSNRIGLGLRQARLQASGGRPGPEHAPRGSVTLCLSTGSIGSELVAELLVRVLSHQGLDARHFTLDECVTPKDDEALDALGLVFLVELPEADSPQGHRVLQALGVIRQRGLARLVLLRPRAGGTEAPPPPGPPWHFDASADSLEAAVAWVDPQAH